MMNIAPEWRSRVPPLWRPSESTHHSGNRSGLHIRYLRNASWWTLSIELAFRRKRSPRIDGSSGWMEGRKTGSSNNRRSFLRRLKHRRKRKRLHTRPKRRICQLAGLHLLNHLVSLPNYPRRWYLLNLCSLRLCVEGVVRGIRLRASFVHRGFSCQP